VEPLAPPGVPLVPVGVREFGARRATFYTAAMITSESAVEDKGAELWPIILAAGGLCWLAIAILGLLWAWPLSGTTLNGDYIVSSAARLIHHLLLFLLSACAYRVALAHGWPQERGQQVRLVAAQVVLALLITRLSPLILTMTEVITDGRWSHLGEDMTPWLPFHPTWMQWVGLLRSWMVPYLLGLIAVALVYTARQYHRESMRLARLSTEVANLRMTMLSAQLHPHFLFNALHAISELITESPAQATTMIARLGDFLRIALESTKQPWIRVEAEVVGLDAYLAVQQTRFRDRLSVALLVDPAAMNMLMPALLLQPIVENAIEHGRCGSTGSLAVGVRIRREGDRLIIEVTNSAPQLIAPLSRSAFGDGLRNVEARLRAAFGDDASVRIGPGELSGTRAMLDMPASAAQAVPA